uniref:NAD(P)H-quinone oxidoreductase subunit 5, chloroplastic n=1 Tax=Viviania marifolia TaxID=28971 RepID=V9P7L2_VIVMA|nr:NADH-plastoquinone oxidoreductase subunit 5 [Viviania marifolia]AGV02878.1 NADH-plastoquinone oxidoreductase subunit 5 [Viviania marifolia]
MEHTYEYSWIIPFLPLLVSMLIGAGLLFFPTATKNLRRIWTILSIFFLSLVMLFSIDLFIQQINSSSIYQHVWSWTINNDFSFEFGHLIDPLTSIMLILITTVGILVLIYSDNYMSHDQGYLKFFAYMNLFNTSMLGLVTSSNLIQIYIFWELVGMCSYLLIGFWFTRPIAANACQKAFVTNRVGDFGLLLGILGLYWITGSFEFRDLFQIFQNLAAKNQVNWLFVTLCAFLLLSGAISKSAQFPFHVWLPDAMEGPTPISALIHAATMVAAGIFLVARLLPLFLVIPYIMNLISVIGLITVLLGATFALAQKDIKRSLAYSTMSQLGYMMFALGMGSYRAALFHLITHAYSKALLFLGSGSIIHSMEPIIGYSPERNQNMVLMGGLTKYVPITKIAFLGGTLSLCGIPPLACFWSKDGILNDSWLYSPSFAIIACFTAGLTAFYMFRIYLLTFEGHLNAHFQHYNGQKNSSFYSISLWGKKELKRVEKNFTLLNNFLILRKNLSKNEKDSSRKDMHVTQPPITQFYTKSTLSYPQESDNTMLFPMLTLILFTLFVGSLGIPFIKDGLTISSTNSNKFIKESHLDILSKLLNPSINLLYKNSNNSVDWYEFFIDATFSVSIAFFGIVLASFLYKPIYSSFQKWNLHNLFSTFFSKAGSNKFFFSKVINIIYDWSYNSGYIDAFYARFLTKGIRKLAAFTHFFDTQAIDGITNGIGITSFVAGESIKYAGDGRISSYLLFFFFYLLFFFFFLSFLN